MIHELMKSRRSIRQYKNKKIEKEKIKKLEEVCLLSPTSKNKKPCKFIFVENQKTLEMLSDVKPKGGRMIAASALSVVILADPNLSDVWIEDASIASAYLHLTCHSLGLGSCWVQIRNRMKNYDQEIMSETLVKEILEIPDYYSVLSIVAIGYPNEIKEHYNSKALDYDSVYKEKYKGNN